MRFLIRVVELARVVAGTKSVGGYDEGPAGASG
jgi:hypothetical protein